MRLCNSSSSVTKEEMWHSVNQKTICNINAITEIVTSITGQYLSIDIVVVGLLNESNNIMICPNITIKMHINIIPIPNMRTQFVRLYKIIA